MQKVCQLYVGNPVVFYVNSVIKEKVAIQQPIKTNYRNYSNTSRLNKPKHVAVDVRR